MNRDGGGARRLAAEPTRAREGRGLPEPTRAREAPEPTPTRSPEPREFGRGGGPGAAAVASAPPPAPEPGAGLPRPPAGAVPRGPHAGGSSRPDAAGRSDGPEDAGSGTGLPGAVLFDRDDTLVVDVPYNGDPERVRLMPGAFEAVRLLRARGIPVGVVSNQSGIGRGLLTEAQVREVNARVDTLLGRPMDVWVHCPHTPEEGCGCRKPAPGLVLEAARRLGVPAGRCVVIGDIGADMGAARAAGARGVLVPTTRTLPAEVASAPDVCRDLLGAVRHVLGRPSAVRRPG
ncbi:D-glycero-alpha-D-manno-heptose-1,7-bisphosphate 7-phosphatase [Streptomyces fradiae]|uniref:D-glycero-alpha-D-manno-heptose-1,7-bisphosphate 7-phosphatase n=1 Tax=Streptomyces fradiae TaxID=1906 RepID=UPI0036698410